jgi:hypothetical protein
MFYNQILDLSVRNTKVINFDFQKAITKGITSVGTASILMLSQGLLWVSSASAEVTSRAHGRCKLSIDNATVFDGHCVIKHKENSGNQVVVVKLDNDSKYKFSGPNMSALQVEAWDGIHNVRYRGDNDSEVFVWDVDGDRNRLSVKADTQHDPNVSHDASTEDALGTALGALAGALIGGLITGGDSSSSSSSSNQASLPKNPYQVGDYYNAASYFKCSVGQPSHDKMCPGGIKRRGNGEALIVVQFPNGYEVNYDFGETSVTSSFGGNLDWSKSGDDWYIGITKGNDKLYIIVPEAAVSGG